MSKAIDIKYARDKAFNAFQTKLNGESPKKINERIVAIDGAYKKFLDTMSWEVKRELILDLEFNYIQQCGIEDLTLLYLS